MARGIIILLLIVVASFLIFEMCNRDAGAQDAGTLSQVLKNQKIILEKLDAIDKKLDVIKMRIRM